MGVITPTLGAYVASQTGQAGAKGDIGVVPLVGSDPQENTWLGSGAMNRGGYTTAGESVAVGCAALGMVTSGGSNVAVGSNTLHDMTTGTNSVAVGAGALYTVSTTSDNTAVGNVALQFATGSGNTAVGSSALAAQTTANQNVALGETAGGAVTTGGTNTFVGANAGYNPNGASANKTIAAGNQVAIGYQAGASAPDQQNDLTAVGANAIAAAFGVTVGANAYSTGTYGMALGAGANSVAGGAVAIGTDHLGNGAASAVQDLIVIGTANHTTRIPGLPAFVSGDKYLVVDSSGNIHKSALGPAS